MDNASNLNISEIEVLPCINGKSHYPMRYKINLNTNDITYLDDRDISTIGSMKKAYTEGFGAVPDIVVAVYCFDNDSSLETDCEGWRAEWRAKEELRKDVYRSGLDQDTVDRCIRTLDDERNNEELREMYPVLPYLYRLIRQTGGSLSTSLGAAVSGFTDRDVRSFEKVMQMAYRVIELDDSLKGEVIHTYAAPLPRDIAKRVTSTTVKAQKLVHKIENSIRVNDLKLIIGGAYLMLDNGLKLFCKNHEELSNNQDIYLLNFAVLNEWGGENNSYCIYLRNRNH